MMKPEPLKNKNLCTPCAYDVRSAVECYADRIRKNVHIPYNTKDWLLNNLFSDFADVIEKPKRKKNEG